MPECVMFLASAKILARRRCDFSWPWIRLSAPPHPFTHRRLKHRQRTKINKTMLSASLHRSFTQSSQYQNWKTNKYSILTVSELGPPVTESSTRISKFYAPAISEHKFYKTGNENCLPIGFNLGSPWLGSHNHYTMFNRCRESYIPIRNVLE